MGFDIGCLAGIMTDPAMGSHFNRGEEPMREIDPAATSRVRAFDLWLKAPMPMVTFFKSLDVGRLIKFGKKRNLRFNMLMCWCVGQAARQIGEFFMLPVGEKLMLYDRLAVATMLINKEGQVSSCDIPLMDDLDGFNRAYLALTAQAAQACADHDEKDCMVIGTSNLAAFDLDGAVGMYSGIYNNPFLIWGKYRRRLWGSTLKISFQFHHSQMDGAHAARFLQLLEDAANGI